MGIVLTLLLSGQATYYDAGVMEQVVANRIAWGQVVPCPACLGYVALLDPDMLGQRVWLRRPGRASEGPYLVTDCAAAGHREALHRRGWAVDVDWRTAQRWGMRGPVPIEVLVLEEPER